jgi:4-hydroxy-tetrahydrodipicolinate synthase
MGVLPPAPFGRLLSAMVTPFTGSGALDLEGAARLATWLVDGGHDGLVISGTTGESATTTDDEKDRLIRTVVEAVGNRATIVAGVGTNDTAHSVELARAAEKAGAHALLAVTPYYTKPPEAGLLAHFRSVADASGLPVMLYDIPSRTGLALQTSTLIRLAEHPRIVAVKDAKGDLKGTAQVRAATDLAYYSGEDVLTLPLLSLGAVGVVGVPTHVAGPHIGRMIELFDAGDAAAARDVHLRLLPVLHGFFRTQGVILTKAALNAAGLPAGPVRLPLVEATETEVAQLRHDCEDAGIDLDNLVGGRTA